MRQFIMGMSLFFSLGAIAMSDDASKTTVPPALNFEVKSLDGKPVKLSDYQGKVLVVVNVASECGATPQYSELQTLYSESKEQGLVVLGFPCNQFGGQEPGTASQIREFCTREYQVTFPMFAKVDVSGPKAEPFFEYLAKQETQPKGAGKINWNFEKFVIGRDGKVVGRYGTGVEPNDPEFVQAVKQALAQKK